MMRDSLKSNRKNLKDRRNEGIGQKEILRIDEAYFKNAKLNSPKKKAILMRLDRDVLEWFNTQTRGYPARKNFCYINSWKHTSHQ